MEKASDNNNLLTQVPDTVSEFQIDIVGNVSKKRFLGDFKCRIPTIQDQIDTARTEAKMCGELPDNLNQGMRKMILQLAYLKYTLIEFPNFWKDSNYGAQLRDINVIETIYDTVIEKEQAWLNKIWSVPEDVEDGQKEG